MTMEEAIEIFEHNWTRIVNEDYTDEELGMALDTAVRSLEACKQIQTMVFDHLGDWDSDADEVIINIKDVLKEVKE